MKIFNVVAVFLGAFLILSTSVKSASNTPEVCTVNDALMDTIKHQQKTIADMMSESKKEADVAKKEAIVAKKEAEDIKKKYEELLLATKTESCIKEKLCK